MNRTPPACRRAGTVDRSPALYFFHVLCCARQRAQTFALSLTDDHGDAAEARRASPPRSGKPEGIQAFPLEPRVQGRFAGIAHGGGLFFAPRHDRAVPAGICPPAAEALRAEAPPTLTYNWRPSRRIVAA